MSANSFYPAVGGYERVALIVAHHLVAHGHSLKIVTLTPSSERPDLPFEIYRNPSLGVFLKLLRGSDIYIQNNVSLNLLWPILFCWRPLVCIHHGFYKTSRDTLFSLKYRLKHLITFFSTNISVSGAVAESLPARSHVIANPYRDDLFFRVPGIQKSRDLFFVGRIVSDKGIDVLIEALAQLRDRGLQPTLTVAGSGPEEPVIRQKVKELDLEKLVTFAGRVSDIKLNELLNAHKIMIVPTREGEGFGVVALEGIACGCVLVGSTCGGLPEAIGLCGKTFLNGDSSALSQLLHDLLTNQQSWDTFFIHAQSHLDKHRPPVVGDKYAEVIAQLVLKQN
jgi:glycogen synthase